MRYSIAIIILVFGLSITANAQIPVSDVVANSQLTIIAKAAAVTTAKQVEEAASLATTAMQVTTTANTVMTTLNHLKEIEEKLEVVSSVLTTAIYVKNIVAREKEILATQRAIAVNTKEMKYITLEELRDLNDNLILVLKTTGAFISLANDLLKPKTLRMDDYSRLQSFLTIDKQLAIQQSIMRAYYHQYQVIEEERTIMTAINPYKPRR